MKIRNSLSTKIILVVEAILLFSSAIFCVVSVSRAQIAIRASIRQRMVDDIANCAAGSMNGDILKILTADNMDSPEYKTAYDSIAVLRDNVELEYIYCIKDEAGGDPDAGMFEFAPDETP